MIVISKVEMLEVPYSRVQLLSMDPDEDVPLMGPGGEIVDIKTVSEIVKGRRISRDGFDVIMGCTGQAAEAMGFVWSARGENDEAMSRDQRTNESLKRQLDSATDIINRQQQCEHALMTSEQELLNIEDAGLMLRLKWLFTGINK